MDGSWNYMHTSKGNPTLGAFLHQENCLRLKWGSGSGYATNLWGDRCQAVFQSKTYEVGLRAAEPNAFQILTEFLERQNTQGWILERVEYSLL